MRVYIGSYHGSKRELEALSKAGYDCEPGSMRVKFPVEGDPWEIAKKIYTSVNGRIKAAIGNIYLTADGIENVQVFVSDDWFSQR